jgi:acyl carrier protein/4'-phosphopantetheinyl transferase EntD
VTTALALVPADTPLDRRDLTTGERDLLAALPGRQRRRQWLTARRALRRALAGCGLPTDTSAHRMPSPVVSLSHSGGVAVAAVAVAGRAAVAGVGVDIELDRTPDGRTARFFLTAAERAWLGGLAGRDRPAELVRLWTVKEALFKADPANARTALADYAVADPASCRGGAARAGSALDFRYVCLRVPRGVISAAVALHQPWRIGSPMSPDFDRIARHISTLISVPVERLGPDSTLAELVPDSFVLVEVAMDLQEEYDVILSQDDLREIRTLGDLAGLIRARHGAPDPS